MPPARYTELEVSGEAFDRPPCPPRTKIVICATQRTGSYLLCRAMIHCGLGVPHEYFHHLHIPLIGPRCGLAALADSARLQTDPDLRQSYIAALLQRRTVNGIFAVKLQGGEYAEFLDNNEGMELLEGADIIYLWREDLLGQAISRHIAMLTGRWGTDATVTTPPAENPDFFDSDQIIRHANELAREDASWRLFFVQNGIRPLILSYESLCADIGGSLRKIVAAFHLDLPAADCEYAEPPAERPAQEPLRAAIRQRFLALNRRFDPAAPCSWPEAAGGG